MTDEEYINNISSVSTEELFNSLEYYGYDPYYAELWRATIEELKKRVEERPHGEWIEKVERNNDIDDLTRTERLIDNAPTVWHPFTEEPTEECQYLVQHYYKSWSGKIINTYEVIPSLEELVVMVKYNKKNGNRDNHYQAWMKIEPYEEEENE